MKIRNKSNLNGVSALRAVQFQEWNADCQCHLFYLCVTDFVLKFVCIVDLEETFESNCLE